MRARPGKLLAADIGNTDITLGLFSEGRLTRRWRLKTETGRSVSSYGRAITRLVGRKSSLAGVVYGSVVPKLNKVFEAFARSHTGRPPIAVTPKSPLGLRLRVDRPSEVGADRLLNSLAAFKLFGGPIIVLDFGTATTFDCVSKRGDYLGGAILPGPELSARALSLYTAKLPKVEMRPTRRVIGKNTVECIQAGLYHGYIGMIRHVLGRSRIEMKGRVKVIATGGLARMFIKEVPEISEIEPNLTLYGLRIAYETIC